MSLIEQAAKRLQMLRRAGVEFPEEGAQPPDQHRRAIPAAAEPEKAPASSTPAETPRRTTRRSGADDPVTRPQPVSRQVQIDLGGLAANHIITPDLPKSRISEEFRLIKRPLIANAMGRGAAPLARGNLIMVTSALPREGKSYTAVNLAISIAAELDKTVLLVDADVARPSILNILGLPPAAGLLDLLPGGTLDLPEVLLRTNIEKLTLLPSGMPRQGAAELLASDAMGQLVDEMADRYPDRIIIFDSPPLLLTSEARELATHMGQVILVVQAESTSQAEVSQALATIKACPVKMVLLNQVRAQTEEGYGSKYGYGYAHA